MRHKCELPEPEYKRDSQNLMASLSHHGPLDETNATIDKQPALILNGAGDASMTLNKFDVSRSSD